MNKYSRFFGAIVFALAGLVLFAMLELSANDAEVVGFSTAEVQYPAPAIEFQTTAAEIASAYLSNPQRADQKFKGKTFEVAGTVDYIDHGFGRQIHVVLRSGVPGRNPRLQLEGSERASVFWLGKGMHIVLVCVGDGVESGVALARSCIVAK